MKKLFLIFSVLFTVYSLQFTACFAAEPVSSDKLIENENFYDGKEVVYKGEAVGDLMKRGDHFWINILEGSNAIGIWCTLNMKNTIQITGDYGHKGDIMQVRGIFHKACKEHGGDLDIHAMEIFKLSPGQKTEDIIEPRKVIAAIVFSVAALAAGIFYFITKRRPL